MWERALLGQISQVLFVPVIVVLLLLVGWMILQLGLLLRSGIDRARGVRPARRRYVGRIETAAAETPPSLLDIRLEEVVQQAEAEASRALNSVRFAVRVGPSLGLIGTLIPMSAALTGLAQGDLPSLAGNMVIAFSSTIVGIAVGVVAYAIALVREGWTRSDLDAVRIHAERTVRATENAA